MSLLAYPFTCEGLTRAMHALGDTAAKVHASLFSLGIRGKKRCAENCPLAEYIHRVFPGARDVHVYLDDGADAYVLAIPVDGPSIEAAGLVACGRFIRNFDAGLYPDLVKEVLVA